MMRIALALLAVLSVAVSARAQTYQETPSLAPRVAAGELPPVEDRLPERPWVVQFGEGSGKTLGRHGGELQMLMARDRDVRQMVVYGYARLVAYNTDYRIEADILERFEVEDGRIFTFHLRPGHRWSDGHPFTSEDFRYWWERVANHPVLYRFGLPQVLLVDGEGPTVEFPDEHTVRYSWPKPNPYFLPALAGAAPLYIYMPAHYMRQFHECCADPEDMARWNEERENYWARLHIRRGRQYYNANPDLPVLQPWVNTTEAPAERFEFVRNPYFHRVDSEGRQLPYIDRVIFTIADSKIIPAKTGVGESDLQARYLRFDNYTFLKRNEEEHEFRVHRWRTASGSHIALYPNLNVEDPVWRELIQDVRFRRALSLAVDRNEINEIMYFGLADEGANTALPGSPLYREEYREAWSRFDVEEANRLLDEIGLTERNEEGIRLLPDGRPLEIIVESASEGTETADLMTLIKSTWRQAGIDLFPKLTRREMFRGRIYAGQTLVSLWEGLDFALMTPNMSPEQLAPTAQIQLQWPKWGLHHESGGDYGQPPSLPSAQRLLALNQAWRRATTVEERSEIWHEMLSIYTNQVFTIGTVAGTIQPVVVRRRLRNVPSDGIWAWDPGAHLGIYRPDTFYWAPEETAEQAAREGE